MRRNPRLIAAACLCLLAFSAHAQQKKPTPTPTPVEQDDVVRISTELVQTDVMVFDKDGKFVSGLQPEQFELRVGDKPQPITFFESIVTGGRTEETMLRAAGGKKKASQPVTVAGESDPGRTVLFFVNDLHLEPGSIARTHKTISNFIDHMLGPNDQVAITSASGQIGFLQQLTNNPTVLRAALARLKIVAGATPDTQRPYISPYAAYLIVERHDRQLFDAFVDQTLKANSMGRQDRPIAASMVEQRTRTIVGRSDLKVQLRRGYLGPPPEKIKAAAQPATVEATDVLGVTESSSEEIHAAVALGYKRTSGANMQLTTTAQVNAQSPGDSSGTIVVNVLGAVFDSNGKAVGSFKQRVEVVRTRANAPPVYTNVNHQVEVPPGLYQVRVIAAERGTNHLTGVMDWIQIPKAKEGVLSISSVFVGEITEASGAAQIGVNASRRFARSSRLRFTAYIYNAATPPQLGLQIKILRSKQVVLTPAEIVVPTDKISNFANIPYTGELPLSALSPGNYILELTVTDRTKKNSASQQLSFTVY